MFASGSFHVQVYHYIKLFRVFAVTPNILLENYISTFSIVFPFTNPNTNPDTA